MNKTPLTKPNKVIIIINHVLFLYFYSDDTIKL